MSSARVRAVSEFGRHLDSSSRCLDHPLIDRLAERSGKLEVIKEDYMRRTKKTELMIQTVASDFEVEQVAEDENWILFAGERKDFFHIVEYAPKGNGLTQHHIPHLAVATAIETAESGRSEVTENGQACGVPIQGEVSIGSGIGGEMFLVSQGDAVPFSVLGGGLDERLKRVSPTLARARKKVAFEEGQYGIPGATTNAGNPLSSVSKDLIEGIAFEKALRRRLNARDFGLYSAFCTHMDFPCALQKTSCIRELVDSHFDFYGPTFPNNGFLEVAEEVQSRMLPFAIWGPSIVANSARAVEAIQVAVAKLDPVEATQVVLLNGMHGADIFLALATVTGIISFERYKDFKTDGLAPDSEEEQFLRISASFIELFGDVAPPCRGYAGSSRREQKPVATSKAIKS